MQKIDWKYFGNWALESYKIYKGKAYSKISLAAFGLATWLVVTGSPYLASAVVIITLLVATFWFFWDTRSATKPEPSLPITQVVALRHQSFEGNARKLTVADLQSKFQNPKILSKDIDQSQFYKNGILQSPEIALQIQSAQASEIKTMMAANSKAHFAYYGKAHIPLVFTLGYQMQGRSVMLFELDRQNGHWNAVTETQNEDLGIIVESKDVAQTQGDAVVRISVSYPVAENDIFSIVPEPQKDFHISIQSPRIDAIKNRQQVDLLAEAFRTVLDELRNCSTPPSKIHVFCAAPMSVVFALGRHVSATIHPSVLVYNYTSATFPRYAWGVQLTGVVEPCIVRPLTAEQEQTNVQSA